MLLMLVCEWFVLCLFVVLFVLFDYKLVVVWGFIFGIGYE